MLQEIEYLERCQSDNVITCVGYDDGLRQAYRVRHPVLAVEWMSASLEDIFNLTLINVTEGVRSITHAQHCEARASTLYLCLTTSPRSAVVRF